MNKVVHDASTLAAAGASVLRKAGSAVLHRGAGRDGTENRWLIVTVNRPLQEVAPGGCLPEPLADLGDAVESSVRPAPGDKGTELAARRRDPVASGDGGVTSRVSGNDPRQEIRSALRQAKQLLEVGEVLSIDGQPAGVRSPTPTGTLVETVAARAGGEGPV